MIDLEPQFSTNRSADTLNHPLINKKPQAAKGSLRLNHLKAPEEQRTDLFSTYCIACEATDHDVFTEFSDLRLDQVSNGNVRILDEALL